MSKLYSKYIKLKKDCPEKLFLFKSGIFYIALEEDANKLSEIFSFKITNLNDNVIKCGFPGKRLEHYTNSLNEHNILFEIIDDEYSKIENFNDYLNNSNLKNIIQNIIKLDLDDISYKQAYQILEDFQKDLKEII